MHVERSRDFNGSLEVVNRLLFVSLGFIYPAKDSMRLSGRKLMAFLRGEIDCARCGVCGGVALIVLGQQESKAMQTSHLLDGVIEAFEDFQRFLHPVYPFPVEIQ